MSILVVSIFSAYSFSLRSSTSARGALRNLSIKSLARLPLAGERIIGDKLLGFPSLITVLATHVGRSAYSVLVLVQGALGIDGLEG